MILKNCLLNLGKDMHRDYRGERERREGKTGRKDDRERREGKTIERDEKGKTE